MAQVRRIHARQRRYWHVKALSCRALPQPGVDRPPSTYFVLYAHGEEARENALLNGLDSPTRNSARDDSAREEGEDNSRDEKDENSTNINHLSNGVAAAQSSSSGADSGRRSARSGSGSGGVGDDESAPMAPPMGSRVVYRSELAEHTLHPTWAPIEKVEPDLQGLARTTVFTVRVYAAAAEGRARPWSPIGGGGSQTNNQGMAASLTQVPSDVVSPRLNDAETVSDDSPRSRASSAATGGGYPNNSTAWAPVHPSPSPTPMVSVGSHGSPLPGPPQPAPVSADDMPLLEWRVNLRTLQYVCSQKTLRELKDAGHPTLLIELTDGSFYTPLPEGAPVEEDVVPLHAPARAEVTPSCICTLADIQCQLTNMIALTYSAQEVRRRTAVTEESIRELLARRARVLRQQAELRARQHRVAELKERVRREKQSVSAQQQALLKQRGWLRQRLSALNESRGELQERRRTTESSALVAQQKEKVVLMPLLQRISFRQEQLVGSLPIIWPIEIDRAHNVLTVAHKHLSSSETIGVDDEAATALGHVSQIVLLLGRIWGIQLRYKLYPISSRSYVQEDFVDTPSQLWPLFYTRGSEKHKYYKSIVLLNKNLHQLIRSRRVKVKSSRYMLMNLKTLITAGSGGDTSKLVTK